MVYKFRFNSRFWAFFKICFGSDTNIEIIVANSPNTNNYQKLTNEFVKIRILARYKKGAENGQFRVFKDSPLNSTPKQLIPGTKSNYRS